MLQHLDDPVPLPPASAGQRRAVVERGAALRRRRRALAVGIPSGVSVAVAAALVVGLTAPSPGPTNGRPVAPAAAPAEPSATGTVFFGGAEEVPVTVTLPSGWETRDVFVLKTGADPLFGLSFFDVAGIYADGCQWQVVQPPIGPTVDDLVAAYASLPGFEGAVRYVTVDGFTGKQIDFTVPDYDPTACQEGKFGLVREDGDARPGTPPSLWAQAPEQRNEFRILDVKGTRLVVGAGYPPDISAKDLDELHAIVDSVQIG